MKKLIRATRELGSQARGIIEIARRYRKKNGHFPNPLRPATFYDKLALRLMFDRRPLMAIAADKIAARKYAEERLGPSILPALYYVTTHPEEIPFDALPNRFVVKPSHASGRIEFVVDKRSLNRSALLARCRDWLKVNYYWCNLEWGYKNVTPRIMVEEFIDDGTGGAPLDYKLFVFNGTVAMIQVDVGRFTTHRRSLYDLDWNQLPVRYNLERIAEGAVHRPPHLEQMCSAAKTLGREMDFLRLDFYDTAQQLYFGEITMVPGAAMQPFSSAELDRRLGAMWRMPPLRRIIRGRT